MDLCMPAIVYLVLAVLGFFSNFVKKRKSISKRIPEVLINLIIIGLITYALNYVCRRYSVKTSWYILAAMILIPIILALITVLMIGNMINKNK
jgi:amino acid transporter